MDRTEFMQRLAEAIRPRSVPAGMAILRNYIPLLIDLGDDHFTEQSLAVVAAKLPRSPSIGQLRTALEQFHRSISPPTTPTRPELPQDREAREWETRQGELRRDWDDPPGILRKVEMCAGNVPFLRLLAILVAKWAPQHIGYIPPHILALVAQDSDLPVLLEIRRDLAAWPQRPRMTRNEQLDAINQRDPVRPHHLSPEQLDQINPLPDGRKRAQ